MTTTESPATVREFATRFRSTPRGAHTARQQCAAQLDGWGIPYGSDAHDVVTLVVSELCANAVRHCHVPGRDCHIRLAADAGAGTVRVEVTDTRGEALPRRSVGAEGDGEGGRGLLLVEALADRWGCSRRDCGGPRETGSAEVNSCARRQ